MTRIMTLLPSTLDRILRDPTACIIDYVQMAVRRRPHEAQRVLEEEYRNPNGPRYTLIQWLKRNRLHNPTTRVIPNRTAA